MLEFPRPYLKCVGWGCDGSESHKQSETGKWANLQYSIPVVSSGAASLCLWEFWIHSLKASSQISRGVETRTNMKGKGTETTVIFQLPDLCRTNKTAVLQFIGLIKGTSQMKMWWNAACLTFCLGASLHCPRWLLHGVQRKAKRAGSQGLPNTHQRVLCGWRQPSAPTLCSVAEQNIQPGHEMWPLMYSGHCTEAFVCIMYVG